MHACLTDPLESTTLTTIYVVLFYIRIARKNRETLGLSCCDNIEIPLPLVYLNIMKPLSTTSREAQLQFYCKAGMSLLGPMGARLLVLRTIKELYPDIKVMMFLCDNATVRPIKRILE